MQKYKSGYETDHQESLHPALDPGVLKPAAIAHPLHMHGWWCWNLFGLAEALICTRIQRSWRPSTTDHPSHMHWLLLCSWWHRLQPGHSGPETTSIRDNLQIMATHTPIDSIRFQGFCNIQHSRDWANFLENFNLPASTCCMVRSSWTASCHCAPLLQELMAELKLTTLQATVFKGIAWKTRLQALGNSIMTVTACNHPAIIYHPCILLSLSCCNDPPDSSMDIRGRGKQQLEFWKTVLAICSHTEIAKWKET